MMLKNKKKEEPVVIQEGNGELNRNYEQEVEEDG